MDTHMYAECPALINMFPLNMFLGASQRCVIPRGTSGGFPSVGSRDLTGSCLPNLLTGAQNIKEMT